MKTCFFIFQTINQIELIINDIENWLLRNTIYSGRTNTTRNRCKHYKTNIATGTGTETQRTIMIYTLKQLRRYQQYLKTCI